MGSLNPLLDSVRPAFMSSLSLVRIDLGDRTPHISGVKFVSANPLTEEVTLDVEVRVVTDESLVAELRLVSNLGAAAVVTLRDLFLVGTLRITLNPLCVDWPCFRCASCRVVLWQMQCRVVDIFRELTRMCSLSLSMPD